MARLAPTAITRSEHPAQNTARSAGTIFRKAKEPKASAIWKITKRPQLSGHYLSLTVISRAGSPDAYEDAGIPKDKRREPSLEEMRRRMFGENDFSAAIFIGGMKGVIDEFELFGSLNPHASRIPIISTGGVTAALAERLGDDRFDAARMARDVDYVPLFHELCEVSFTEPRNEVFN